ncbi:glycosyltransferase [Streptomyces sp. NPDC001404]|uniref:glycosyltransferase n=1 Tax=Streptomyces sp. NPDC001404 TaxID=3364571 RepID=UPI0036C9105E
MRIVQIANFYGPSSSGLRTAVNALGEGYVRAGHERVLIVPGGRYGCVRSAAHGLRMTLPGVPVGRGYRLLIAPGVLRRLLERLAPDSVEVSDKSSLVHAGTWARARGVRAVLFSHERLDAILSPKLPRWVPLRRTADAYNRRLLTAFDAVVAASAFSCAEFARIAAPVLHQVPLGVDLETFSPSAAGPAAGRGGHEIRLVYVGRLWKEKYPQLPVETLRVLRRRGIAARLDVLGEGPERAGLERRAAGLPVRFHGHVAGRRAVAAMTARADVALAPCPVEAFGLSVLEALACGTPVVTADRGGAAELLAPDAGFAAPLSAPETADAVLAVLDRPEGLRRAAARARAEQFPWSRTVARMLAVHAGPTARPALPRAVRPRNRNV